MTTPAPAEPVILITGATGALGRLTAAAFAPSGARLGLAGRDPGVLAELAADVGAPDDRWSPAVGDLRTQEGAAAAVGMVIERFGRVDIAVHLVGGWVGGTSIVDLDPDELRGMLDQHVWSTFHLARAVVPGMTERGWGRIVAVTSAFTANPSAHSASYIAAKSAQEAILRVLAREVAGAGVTVNTVAVRAIDAAHARETAPTRSNAGWTTPEEIVEAIRFLCSDGAAAINGARIPLDGRT